MEPENTPLEEEIHLPNHHFQFYVNFWGVYLKIYKRWNEAGCLGRIKSNSVFAGDTTVSICRLIIILLHHLYLHLSISTVLN